MKFILFIILMEMVCLSYGQQSFLQFKGPSALSTATIYSLKEGPQAIYCNPAKIVNQPGWSANISVQNQYEILAFTCYQASLLYSSNNFGALGIGLQQFGTSAFREQKIQLSYAKSLEKDLFLGIGFHGWQTKSHSYEAQRFFTFDIGLAYAFLDKYEISLHIFNPLVQRYSSERQSPTVMTIGFRYKLHDHIHMLFEGEKNLYHELNLKFALMYQIVERYLVAIGLSVMESSPVISGGFHFKTKKHLNMDFGISYHQVLGFSSAIGFDYYLR